VAQTCEGPPRGWGCADGPEVVCFGGEQFPDSAPATLREWSSDEHGNYNYYAR
jgi:hypothetical protein